MGSEMCIRDRMYVIDPRMTQDDGRVAEGPPSTLNDRRAELMMVEGWRATRALRGAGDKKAEERAARIFKEGDLVLVARGELLANIKMVPAFNSIFYGPCRVVKAHHPRYDLPSSTGKKPGRRCKRDAS